MAKKIFISAMALLLWLSGVSAADEHSDRITELENQIAEMTGKLQAMQEEIAALKDEKTKTSQPTENSAPAVVDNWTDKVGLSGQVRARGYDFKNVWNYDDHQAWDSWNTFRTKGSLTATVKATDDVTAVLQITNQTYGNGVTTKYGQELDNASNKFFLENAYIHTGNVFGLPVNLTLGRQNLRYGNGFVLFDGNSQFASTSGYFDGVKLSWRTAGAATLDAFYMQDEENNRDNASDDDISLTGVYFTGGNTPVLGKSELYLLNRRDETLEKNIWMFGGRLSNTMENGLDYSLEAAYQTGNALENVDQKAYGTKIGAGYTFKETAFTPRLFGGFSHLSGDDPDTRDNEGWDVFYGGWAGQFGDLMAWAFVNLPGEMNVLNTVYDHDRLSSTSLEAVFSNLQVVTFGADVKLMKDISVMLSYSSLVFDETYDGVDDDFGDFFQVHLKYRYNRHLNFYLYGALLAPGDALNHTAKDNAAEIFWETDFRF